MDCKVASNKKQDGSRGTCWVIDLTYNKEFGGEGADFGF